MRVLILDARMRVNVLNVSIKRFLSRASEASGLFFKCLKGVCDNL